MNVDMIFGFGLAIAIILLITYTGIFCWDWVHAYRTRGVLTFSPIIFSVLLIVATSVVTFISWPYLQFVHPLSFGLVAFAVAPLLAAARFAAIAK